MATNNVLKVTSDAELLSFIINQDPILASEIDLPVQGQSIKPIGKLISSNKRYKNAFINTVNLIGLTLIKRNNWENPWNFTVRGTLNFGQQIREIILDLARVYDYNEEFEDKTKFLDTVVPDVYQYIHEVNFQKFYQTTTSDAQLAMAFEREGGLIDFVVEAIGMLYESYQYDSYIVDKYMLCRRVLDGTVPATEIDGFSNLTARQRVSKIKSVSNKMTFRSPNYNPAGVNRATSFDNQILIVSTDFEAEFSTEVLATSFFKDEADMKARLVLVDGFNNHDNDRLTELLGAAFVAFTSDELAELAKIPCVLISNEWFMDYVYALDGTSDSKKTEFYNPTTLENNHFLHVWRVFSTSPFENCTVFTEDITPAVTSVTVTPSTATVSKGLDIQLKAAVVTTGFANKAVTWSVVSGEDVTVTLNGLVHIPADFSGESVTIKATSVFDTSKSGQAVITIAS